MLSKHQHDLFLLKLRYKKSSMNQIPSLLSQLLSLTGAGCYLDVIQGYVSWKLPASDTSKSNLSTQQKCIIIYYFNSIITG